MKLSSNFYSKRSLFIQYMNVSIVIVLMSFLVLGIILTLTITNYWSNEKQAMLDSRAQSVSNFIRLNMSVTSTSNTSDSSIYIIQPQKVREFLGLYVNDSGMDIIITDMSSRTVLTASADGNINLELKIPEDTIRAASMTNSYFTKGTLGDIYESDRYISARPILSKNSSGIVGMVFVTSNVSDIQGFSDMVLKIFILSAIAALALSILAIGLFSYNLVKPLKQMSQAAKQFGKGDFSVRVSESGSDEIGELAVAFNNMADSLSSSENARKSFIANVSHELKTPMTTIAGFIDGILDGTIPQEKQHYYLHIVSEEIKRLSRLVRSMLDLSRIDNGELKLNYQSFDMLDVLVTIIITFEKEIDSKNIEIRGLDTISPKVVYGDKDLIHQVIYNLVENAVKFTNENGYIEFNMIESLERFDFIIKNSGTGIKSSEIGLVFDRFYKTDKSRSKDKKGLGLGLYLVRSIIRLHGGDITAKSSYGEYCEFDFYIPKKQTNKKTNRKSLPM